MGDAAGRDQYLTFRDQDVNVFWNGRNGNAEPVRGPDGKPIKNSVSDSTPLIRTLPVEVALAPISR